MHDSERLAALAPDQVLDGGALDCGSGLVLLIRERMQAVPKGGLLELRSVESTVRDDLPAWCRMVGHEFLGALAGGGAATRYFVRRGEGAAAEQEAVQLAADRQRARDYEWRLRARSTAPLATTVYCRNFQWQVGQPTSFEERDAHPCAVEAALGALAGDLVTGFRVACSRAGLEVDDVELTARGRLHDVMAHLGLGDGDPGFAAIDLKLFVSTFADETAVRATWAETLRRSPLAATLAKAVTLTTKLAIV
ncbi:MAG: OsmC family protein [Planctomycetes bacterium]|nr:OsmC family protein [Planctomycetota bacterium]